MWGNYFLTSILQLSVHKSEWNRLCLAGSSFENQQQDELKNAVNETVIYLIRTGRSCSSGEAAVFTELGVSGGICLYEYNVSELKESRMDVSAFAHLTDVIHGQC